MDDVRVSRRVFGAAIAAGVFGVALVFAGPAGAASCAQISISPGVQSPTLAPKTATINAGGCAAYTNKTAFPVRVTVGKLSDVANPNGVVTFVERAAGRFSVTAQEQLQGQGFGGSGTGTLVVRAAPAPKPSPHPTATPTPQPSSSASSHPTAQPSSSGPVVAPTTPAPPTAPGATPSPNDSGQGNPPVIVGMPPPTANPSSSPAVAPEAQLQPPSGRATGLPAAIAALLVVGAAAAFVRVLLAEPAGLAGSGLAGSGSAGSGSAGSGDDRRFVPRVS
jgi:hypothetical protein